MRSASSYGKRPQQQRVRDAEDRRVGTDAERERRDGDGRERRLRREDAKSVTEVMPPGFHDSPLLEERALVT